MAKLVKRLPKEEFFKLQTIWYQKVIKSGFKDIEKLNNSNVVSFYSNSFDLKIKGSEKFDSFYDVEVCIIQHYDLYKKCLDVTQLQDTARLILDEEHFLYNHFSDKEKELLQLFTEGTKYKDMVSILSTRYKKKKFMGERSKITIRYLQHILDTIFLKSYKLIMSEGRGNERQKD